MAKRNRIERRIILIFWNALSAKSGFTVRFWSLWGLKERLKSIWNMLNYMRKRTNLSTWKNLMMTTDLSRRMRNF